MRENDSWWKDEPKIDKDSWWKDDLVEAKRTDRKLLAEYDAMTVQLGNIIRVCNMYGEDASFYKKELLKWENKRSNLLRIINS